MRPLNLRASLGEREWLVKSSCKLEARRWIRASVFATSKTVEGNPKRLKHGCKRWVLGGLVTDLETQQCEQGLDQVRGSVGERLGHHCQEIVIEAGPGQAKKASAKRMNGQASAQKGVNRG